MFNDTSHPRFRIVAALAPCAKKPIDGLSGWSRMMSDDFLLYHVTLASARSLKNPRSTPASNSFERSGFNDCAGRSSERVTKPPMPSCVGVLPVPCEMPPTRPLVKVSDVRYGSGSWPASPYATRAFPYESHDCSPIAFVNSHATLPFGNQLRRFDDPNVEEPSLRSAAIRCSWFETSSPACPNHDASWITVS